MRAPRGLGPSRLAFAAVLLFLLVPGGSPPPAAAQAPAPDVAVDRGARLFLGQARFQAGGPPCGSCHRLSTLAFPNGGTVGPDLSLAYETLGEDGTDATLQTLFFPTMMPLYDKRPLAPQEQQALKALLKHAAPAGPVGRDTLELAGIAALGWLLLMAATWLAGRHRLHEVRASLVRQAAARGART